MDTALNINGDFDIENGSIYAIDGINELKQSLYIALAAHKGAFIYDRELGSDIFETDFSRADCIEEIERKARNALCDFPDAEVVGVVVDSNIITLSVEYEDEILEIKLIKQEG